jgi:hypothetical protein
MVVRAEPELQHPLRLVLEPADLLDGLAGETALRLLEVDDVVVEGELVALVLDEVAGGCHRCSVHGHRRPP